MRGPLYHLHRTTRRLVLLGCLSILGLTLASSTTVNQLDRILNDGVLRMITLAGPTTYYENARGPTGYEYLLAKAFAEHLGVELKVTLMDSIPGILSSVGTPKGHFAAAGLSVTPQRMKHTLFSEPYSEVMQKVVYRAGTARPDSIPDLLGGELLTVAGSAHTERLNELKHLYPDLNWREHPNAEVLELMEMVHSGEAEFAVVDSHDYLINRSLFPNAREAFDLSEPQPLAWAFPKRRDTSLLAAANRFLQEFRDSGQLARLEEQFHGHTERFSAYGSRVFIHHLNTRLPQYLALFQETATELGLDWHLLAAMAYQESHWDPLAVSPTGVVGLMMLTRAAASEVNVTNRRDPEQSITGGAQYFIYTYNRIADRIQEPDRTWLALAAYNIGYGHLEDARILTERNGANPDRWEDVKEHLPLLQKRAHYSTVRFGYARGWEAVHYVENIRHYRSILQWKTLSVLRREEKDRYADQLENGEPSPPLLLRPL